MINFMCQLDRAKGCQIAGKTLFLGMSMRVSPEENSICVSRHHETQLPHSG